MRLAEVRRAAPSIEYKGEFMSKEYKIYPIPQKAVYSGETYPVPAEMKVLRGSELTPAIEKRLSDTLALRKVEESGSAGFALTVQLDETLGSGKHDYYQLTIEEQAIRITAAEESGLFYGLTTLWHIFEQSESGFFAVEIEDYSELQLRGLIEGYYGIPWSDESRKSIMDFGSYFKMNIYAFAPKDDPYHRDRWWELYPEEQLNVIGSLAQFGEEHYNHYVWTIAPFKAEAEPIRDENKEEGLQKVIAKFEQLYAAGVRQFGVLGDDVGNLPYDTVVFVMNKLNAWRKEKGDIRDLIFCPEGYTMQDWAFKDGSEMNTYEAGFDKDIHIFFTGMSVCSPVTKRAVEEFKTRAVENGERRDPLFWMNWPVNDIDRTDYRRVFMGKGEVYEPGVTDMTGVLTNPMEEAEASKVALFATLDYAWNVHAFDDDKSWEDSFRYIEPDAPEALHEISKHMSGLENGAKADAEESVELGEIAARFTDAYERGSCREEAAELKAYYEVILRAVDQFKAETKNEQLLKELTPYLGSLQDKARAAVYYLSYLESGDEQVKSEADSLTEQAKMHYIHTRTAEFPNTKLYAETGRKVINKNLEQLKAIAEEDTRGGE